MDIFICDRSIFCQFDFRTVEDAGPYSTKFHSVTIRVNVQKILRQGRLLKTPSCEQNNVCEVASALFLLPIAGTKEKAKQKENAIKESFAACGRRPKALPLETAAF